MVDPLGNPLDGKGPINAGTPPDRVQGAGIVERQPVKEPLQTGLKAIDSMTPIGRGQRELIIGDRKTGKTAIAIDTIINQKDRDVICVYVAIGQTQSTVVQVVARRCENGAMDYTIVVAAPRRRGADPVHGSLRRLARWPSTSCTTGPHTSASTTTCPSTPSPTGSSRCCSAGRRAARPTRATCSTSTRACSSARCKLSDERGRVAHGAADHRDPGGRRVSAYIPTNVISITDGQIFLEQDLFYSGVRPAINVGISVSRVGGEPRRRR